MNKPTSTFKIAWRDAPGQTADTQILDHGNFAEFASMIHRTIAAYKKDTNLKNKNASTWFVRGSAKRRTNADLQHAELLIADIDKSKVNPGSCSDLLSEQNVTHYIYTTTSHKEGNPRYRIVVPHRTYSGVECKRATAYLQSHIPEVEFAKESYTWSQEWFLPINGAEEYGHIGNEFVVPTDFESPFKSDDQGRRTTGKKKSTSSNETFEDYRREMIRTGELHTNYVPMIGKLKMQGSTLDNAIARIMPEIELAAEIHDRTIDVEKRVEDLTKAYESGEEPQTPVIDTKDIASSTDTTESIIVDRLPNEVLAPDDMYGGLVKALYETMWVPNIMSAHVAADGVIAYTGGGKYSGRNKKDRVNVFELISGDSGDGKGMAIEGPREVADYLKFNNKNLEIGKGITSDIGSAQAIDQMLVSCGKRPDVLFCWDEFGDCLIEFSTKGDGSPRSKIITKSKELWPVSHIVRDERILVSTVKGSSRPSTFYAPHFSIIGAGTEDSIAQGVDISRLADGFFSRILLMPALPYTEKPRMDVPELSLSSELVISLTEMFAEKQQHGNIYTPETARVGNPVRVNWDDEVKDYFYNIALERHDMPRGLHKTLCNRKVVNVKKKAMIRALINDPVMPVVTLEIAKWANVIVSYSLDYSGKLFEGRLHYSQFDAAVTAIANYLKKNTGKWIKKAQIMNLNQMRRLGTKNQIDGALAQLLSRHSENIEIGESTPPRGKSAPVYRWID